MNSSGDPRVLHVITAFNSGGGAETLLLRLLEQLDDGTRRGHQVLSLRERGSLAPEAERLGVRVTGLNMTGDPSPSALAPIRHLAKLIRTSRAEVVQTWMLHANVLAGIAAQVASQIPVVWGVHVSEVDLASFGAKAVIVQRVESVASWIVPARIIACSSASRMAMESLHYRKGRVVTIHNGIDVQRFRPDPAEGRAVRAELGIDPDSLVIGNVARFHPIKDHRSLMQAAAGVLKGAPDARLVLCGGDVEMQNEELRRLAEPLGEQVLLLGERADVARLLNAFDLVVSSSLGEALSLAVGEAMATGVPLVATDVGDSAELIGDTGVIVPPGDPVRLEEALARMAAEGRERRRERGERGRRRITDLYSLATMTAGYEAVWREVTGRPPA